MNDTDRRLSWPPWFIWVACGIITGLQVAFGPWWIVFINVILWPLAWIAGGLIAEVIDRNGDDA